MQRSSEDERTLGNVSGDYAELPEGVDKEAFDSDIKKFFETAVANHYRRAFQTCLNDAGDVSAVADELQMDKSTRSRWKRNRVTMSWEHLFLGLAAFDVDLDEKVPRGRDAVAQGVRETVRHIRRQYVDKVREEVEELRLDELHCLYHACLSDDWRSAQTTRDREQLEAAARKILGSPGAPRYSKLRTYRDIESVMLRWSIPWLHFHTVIPHRWVF